MIIVKTKQEQDSPKPFPKLMINGDEEIFYMVREGYGLPITGSNWTFSNEDFANFKLRIKEFADYNEPITIQNA